MSRPAPASRRPASKAGRVLARLAVVGGLATAIALVPSPLRAQAAPDPSAVVGPPRGPALSGPALDERTERVAGLLRCPVCQGLSVADSPSGMAQDMKKQVRDLLAAGYDQEQILVYYEGSYGEFVRLEPPLRGVNWTLWLAPILGLLAGGVVVRFALTRPRPAAPSAPAAVAPPLAPAAGDAALRPATVAPPVAPATPADPELVPYLLRVRELAYGWPGGLPPETPAT